MTAVQSGAGKSAKDMHGRIHASKSSTRRTKALLQQGNSELRTNQDYSQRIKREYWGLFKRSDAMIHDCHSFTVEYLYCENPVLYLLKNHHTDSLNIIATEAFNLQEKASIQNKIGRLVANVINNNDRHTTERLSILTETKFLHLTGAHATI